MPPSRPATMFQIRGHRPRASQGVQMGRVLDQGSLADREEAGVEIGSHGLGINHSTSESQCPTRLKSPTRNNAQQIATAMASIKGEEEVARPGVEPG